MVSYTEEVGLNTSVISNGSSLLCPYGAQVDETGKIASRIQKIVTPVICCLGLIGNTIATTVFLSASQRKTSCSLYLAARSVSDTGFLISLMIVCMTDLGINIFNQQGICQIVIFLTYICGFLSVWFVVMVTLENYVRICHPFKVNEYCNTRIAKIVIICFILSAFALYNFPLWTTGIIKVEDGRDMCSRFEIYDTINQVVTYADTMATLIVPTLMIICLMVAITYSILESLHRQARLKGLRQKSADRRNCSSPQSKVTRLLFAVSFIFIALNLPSHVIRIQMTIKYLYNVDSHCTTMAELAVQKVFQLLYYLSFSVNICIYLICGDKFRKVFVSLYIPDVCCTNVYNHLELLSTHRIKSNPDETTHIHAHVQVPDDIKGDDV